MKIAIVNQPWGDLTPPNPSGSIPILIYETAQRLAKEGHQVTVYSRSKWKKTETVYDGVCYRYIPVFLDKFSNKILSKLIIWKSLQPTFSSFVTSFFYGLQISLDLFGKNYDWVHIHNFTQFIPTIRRLNPKIKILLQIHCEWLTKLDYKMINDRLQTTELILGCSDFIMDDVKKRFPHFADKCHTLFNGVSTTYFTQDSSQNTKETDRTNPIILYIGRVSPEKGIHTLLQAFEIVHSKIPNAQLQLVGPPEVLPYEFLIGLDDDPKILALGEFYPNERWAGYLEEWQRSKPASSNVTFVGNVDYYELRKYYQTADLFVFPSICDEAFGMPVAEAMSSGLPVVVAKAGALPELVGHGTHGWVTEAGSDSDLANTIVQVLQSPDEAKRIAKLGQIKATEVFDWDPVIQRLIKFYQA